MSQLSDQTSRGIDLHFWGQVLKELSEKIQLVSDPESTDSSSAQLPFSSLLLQTHLYF